MKTTALTLLLILGLVAVATAESPAPPEYPDTVTIEALNHWFMPVEFSHGDHVDAVESCSACHHDQAPDEIMACAECHAAEYDPADPDTPDLKMAFHLNCVGCHQQIDGPLACTDCHERAALPEGPELKDAAVR